MALKTGRTLENTPPPMPIIPEQFAQLVQTINAWTLWQIDRIITDYTEQGYFRGVTFATKQLKPYRIEVAFNLPYDREIIQALRTRNNELIRGVTEETRKRIMQEVSTGALNGETIKTISSRIISVVDGMTLPRAQTIARTELMKGVNEGVRKRFETYGVDAYKRIETIDERTCTDYIFHIDGREYRGCASLIGVQFTAEQAAQIDEQTHPNCRGTWAPVFKGLNYSEQQGKVRS